MKENVRSPRLDEVVSWRKEKVLVEKCQGREKLRLLAIQAEPNMESTIEGNQFTFSLARVVLQSSNLVNTSRSLLYYYTSVHSIYSCPQQHEYWRVPTPGSGCWRTTGHSMAIMDEGFKHNAASQFPSRNGSSDLATFSASRFSLLEFCKNDRVSKTKREGIVHDQQLQQASAETNEIFDHSAPLPLKRSGGQREG